MTSPDKTCNKGWFVLKDLLNTDEQIQLFTYIKEHDATDWENLSSCMSPSPKTLNLVGSNGTLGPTLDINLDDANIVAGLVKKATCAVGLKKAFQAISCAVIRYCPPGTNPRIGSCFPPHIDHCNNGSWVVLFSLGCTAIFQIRSPDMSQKETFEMNSGDVLVFDPSSEAAILHGVDTIIKDGQSDTRWSGLSDKFDHLCSSRFGVQCRVLWN